MRKEQIIKEIVEALRQGGNTIKGFSKNENTLFVLVEIQRKTIVAIQNRIDRIEGQQGDLINLQGDILNQYERLMAIIEDLTARIEALEKKEEQKAKLKIVK